MTRAGGLGVLLFATARLAAADPVPLASPGPAPLPTPAPIVTIDDTRTEGMAARYVLEGNVEVGYVYGHGASDSLGVVGWQLAAGPLTPKGYLEDAPISDVLGPLATYAFRVRGEAFTTRTGTVVGPITFGLQHYLPVAPLQIAPLLRVVLGFEVQLSTPWLSDERAAPPRPVAIVDNADTELAANGWSIRPVTPYLRVDFAACRSEYVELGFAPEFFERIKASPEYDVRFHGAAGFSFARCHHADSIGHHLGLQLEYRGRQTLYSSMGDSSYHGTVGAALQWQHGPAVFQLVFSADPGQLEAAWQWLLRIQLGHFERAQ